MAVTYVAGGTTAQVGTTALTVTGVATTPVVDDLLVMWIYHRTTSLIATPSGWTSLIGVSSTAGRLQVFHKKVTASGTQADVVIGAGLASPSMGSMACFRGQDLTTPWLPDSALSSAKTQANLEGTYAVPNTGNSWTRDAEDLAVYAIGADNDALFSVPLLKDSAGTTIGTATMLGTNQTLTGSDCGGGWAYTDLSSGTVGNGTVAGCAFTITEGSAGTADNGVILAVLSAAVSPTTTAGFVHRRGPNYRR